MGSAASPLPQRTSSLARLALLDRFARLGPVGRALSVGGALLAASGCELPSSTDSASAGTGGGGAEVSSSSSSASASSGAPSSTTSGGAAPSAGSSTAGAGGSGSSSSGAATGTTAQGGGAEASGGASSIQVEPGDAPPEDPSRPFARLCGGLECAPGADSACGSESPSELGDAVQRDDCKLLPEEGDLVAEGRCVPPGRGNDGEACQTALDCGVGLGCVREPEGARCRAYCCGDMEACAAGSFCQPRRSAEDRAVALPVCVPLEPCTLLEDATCCGPEGCERTCTIVRQDGSTSCVDPGQGGAGEPCPCQKGYVCGQLTRECMQLCLLGEEDPGCESGGACQAGIAGLPAGIGLCSGGDQRLRGP